MLFGGFWRGVFWSCCAVVLVRSAPWWRPASRLPSHQPFELRPFDLGVLDDDESLLVLVRESVDLAVWAVEFRITDLEVIVVRLWSPTERGR